MEFSYVAVALGLVLAGVEMLLGISIGWWLRGSSNSGRAPHASDEPSRVQIALQRLHELTTSVAADVGEHSSRMQAINDELSQSTSSGELDSAVLDTVTQIVAANSRLQKQLACAEVRLQEQAQQIEVHAADALTDPLTGAANRRALDQFLTEQMQLTCNSGPPVSVLLIDVDNFKQFNDTHGHLAGDDVLRKVVELLQQSVRDCDLVARYGGEEFAVIMPGMDLNNASSVAERARSSIEHALFDFQGQTLRVTASVGTAQALAEEETTEILKRADNALYSAKKAGRNRVYLHDGNEVRPLFPDKPEEEPAATDLNAHESEVALGLLNRTAFFEELRRSFAEARQSESPIAVTIVQIDRLQSLCSRYGEQAGKAVVRTVTQFLVAALREADQICQFNESAFAILMPSVPLEHGVAVGERLRTAIARCPLRIKDNQVKFTVSIGVAEGLASDDSELLVKRAQAAATAASTAGSDRTYLHNGENPVGIEECLTASS